MPQKGQVEEKAQRSLKALDLRITGQSYRAIGKALKVNEATAYRDVQFALAVLDGERKELAEKLREIELERLDSYLRRLDRKISKGDTFAIKAALKVAEQRAKLLGLNAPTQIAPVNPDGSPLAGETTDQLRSRALAILQQLTT